MKEHGRTFRFSRPSLVHTEHRPERTAGKREGYWLHDDEQFAEVIAGEPSEASDEEELLPSSANNH
jgi:hypothetical protein